MKCTILSVNTALMNTYCINIYIAWDQSDQEKRNIVYHLIFDTIRHDVVWCSIDVSTNT